MKKVSSILALCLCFGIAQANKINDLIEKQTGQKTTFLSEQKLTQDSNLKVVTLREDQSGMKVVVITNQQESIIIPILTFFTSNDKDREMLISQMNATQMYNETFKTQAAVKKIIESIPKDYIIDIKGKTSKKLFYIISDPLCPHCQAELANIDKRLEQGDIKMIPIGMLGEQAAKKAAEIHEAMKNVTSDSQKVAILKKIYDPKHKAPQSLDTKKIEEITKSLLGKDKVEGTPYIIEEDR